jgi:hypothetical protein
MNKDINLNQVVPAYFINQPEQVILRWRVKEITSLDFRYFYFDGEIKVERSLIFNVENENIYKINFVSEFLELSDKDNELVKVISDFNIEFFISYGDMNGDFKNPVVMGMDELTYYLSKKLNDKVVNEDSFPKLKSIKYQIEEKDFLSRGRQLRNKYFPEYIGPIFNILDFDSELKEIFAVSSSNLAFLIRFKDRVKGELSVSKNENYISNLNVYPRFNNAIAETASYIYNTWERIVFIINEFFPKKKSSDNFPPSFEQYFKSKNEEFKLNAEYLNNDFLWFYNRINEEHKFLGNLRHPLIHYNKSRETKGMRSAKFSKDFRSLKSLDIIIQQYEYEINFLKEELTNVDLGLMKSLNLIESWSILENKIP